MKRRFSVIVRDTTKKIGYDIKNYKMDTNMLISSNEN